MSVANFIPLRFARLKLPVKGRFLTQRNNSRAVYPLVVFVGAGLPYKSNNTGCYSRVCSN